MAVGTSASMAMGSLNFGLFINPMGEELGIGRSTFGLGIISTPAIQRTNQPHNRTSNRQGRRPYVAPHSCADSRRSNGRNIVHRFRMATGRLIRHHGLGRNGWHWQDSVSAQSFQWL